MSHKEKYILLFFFYKKLILIENDVLGISYKNNYFILIKQENTFENTPVV